MIKLLPLLSYANRRTYVFLHGVECWQQQSALTARVLRDSRATFLSNSRFTWTRFLELNPRWANASHQVVALGVDSPEEYRAEAFPMRRPAALMLGRMDSREAYKGHEEVIRAWPLVRKRVPDAELWIAGEGSLRRYLERTAQETGVGGSIRFFGRISEEEKDQYIKVSRCLLLPSRGEGFGLVYLEAMRRGRPCLGSSLDAAHEVIAAPECGLCVDPRSQKEVAHAIVRLLSDGPEWEQWARAARGRYESYYTGAHFQQRLVNALTT